MNKLEQYLRKTLSENQLKHVLRISRNIKLFGHGNNLKEIARICKTDKIEDHNYITHYITHLKKYKNKKINLLEIGVGGYDNPKSGAASLRMWKKYFPLANIFAIDIYDKSFLQEKRIKIFKGSQVDEEFLNQVVNEIGEIDVIIDDGSHINEHVIKTFNILFPKLKTGGIYIVEDTQTSYWKPFGGDSEDLNNPSNSLSYFKSLTDCLNHVEFVRDSYNPTYFDKHIVSMHFYHNMVFIYKGLNDEKSSWVVDHKFTRNTTLRQ